MSVLLPDAMLGVRRRAPAVADAHGWQVAGAIGALEGPWPGGASQDADGAWRLALDPAAWPLAPGDVVEDDGGRQWTVLGAELLALPAEPAVDWVRVTARAHPPQGTQPSRSEQFG